MIQGKGKDEGSMAGDKLIITLKYIKAVFMTKSANKLSICITRPI
jgi:hypothetical protein